MLQLHFYSNYAGRLVLHNEYHDWWSFETYPLESIKEFEQISQAWKRFLANLLRRGLTHSHGEQCFIIFQHFSSQNQSNVQEQFKSNAFELLIK